MNNISNIKIQKDDIFYADLGETVGSEQSGIRPVLVIQNDVGNKYSPTVIITPLTSKAKKLDQPTHVIIGKRFGLAEYSFALLEQVRTIDRARLLDYVGHADQNVMRLVDKIGDMYQNGYYVKKNPKEAFLIYNRCLDTMTDEAAPTVAGPVFLRVGNAFLEGLGTEKNAMNALICFQKAETFLYDMVAGGEVMYRKSLRSAIDGQAKARKILAEALPSDQWTFDN